MDISSGFSEVFNVLEGDRSGDEEFLDNEVLVILGDLVDSC